MGANEIVIFEAVDSNASTTNYYLSDSAWGEINNFWQFDVFFFCVLVFLLSLLIGFRLSRK